jgi:hypothetical protein
VLHKVLANRDLIHDRFKTSMRIMKTKEVGADPIQLKARGVPFGWTGNRPEPEALQTQVPSGDPVEEAQIQPAKGNRNLPEASEVAMQTP